jgi:hypothetical protein
VPFPAGRSDRSCGRLGDAQVAGAHREVLDSGGFQDRVKFSEAVQVPLQYRPFTLVSSGEPSSDPRQIYSQPAHR